MRMPFTGPTPQTLVSVFVYSNIPEEGMITGVTYGLSAYPHPKWTRSRPELIVAVKSLELDWPLAAATFAALSREEDLLVRRRLHDGFSTRTGYRDGWLSRLCPEHSLR